MLHIPQNFSKHVLEAHKYNSNERYFNDKNQLNASSKADALKILASLAQQIADGEVAPLGNTPERHDEELVLTTREVNEQLASVYKDQTTGAWESLGADIAATLTVTADREGFMRKFLIQEEVAQGNIVRHRVMQKSTTAIVATGPTQMEPRYIDEKYIYPPEFEVKTHTYVSELELAKGPANLLQEKFLESQEAIMTKEDRVLLSLINEGVGQANELQYLAGGLTPNTLAVMQNQVQAWSIASRNLLFAMDVLSDITGSNQFASWFDPVSQYEIVQTGTIGSLLGMTVMTDAYREPRLQVLSPGEVYVTGAPEFVGAYTDRGPVSSREVDGTQTRGEVSRGWMFYEILSMVLHNPRAIVKGVRA